jgi:ribosomal protein S18 acetylase RimI-like enzyme
VTGGPAPQALPKDEIRAFSRRSLHRAARFLFGVFRTDPAVAQLFGFKSDCEMAGISPTFDGLCKSTASIPGCTLGYYHHGGIVGVVTYCPVLTTSMLRGLAHNPLGLAAAYARGMYIRWRHRPRIPAGALVRWHAYGQLARAQVTRKPRLHVLALGVAESARGMGVARQLLDAVASDDRWRKHVEVMQIETWHRAKVLIYERLGFDVVAHGSKDGVDCWTMVRAIPKDET